jgi:hypothetical protein
MDSILRIQPLTGTGTGSVIPAACNLFPGHLAAGAHTGAGVGVGRATVALISGDQGFSLSSVNRLTGTLVGR